MTVGNVISFSSAFPLATTSQKSTQQSSLKMLNKSRFNMGLSTSPRLFHPDQQSRMNAILQPENGTRDELENGLDVVAALFPKHLAPIMTIILALKNINVVEKRNLFPNRPVGTFPVVCQSKNGYPV